MKVKRIFNNNVILAEDKKNEKKMLLGNGIGFNRHVNDYIDREEVEEIYILEPSQSLKDFEELVNHVPADCLILTKKVIEFAETRLDVHFDNSIYIGLADHISYALVRAKTNGTFSNALLWEIKKFYTREFQVSLEITALIQDETNLLLNEDEAGFIAMYLVNGQQGSKIMITAKESTRVIQDILNIVKFHFNIEFDENSLIFARFVTHIKFYLHRIASRVDEYDRDEELFDQVMKRFPKTHMCTLKIRDYVYSRFNVIMNDDELLYFMLHIKVITRE